MKKREITLSPEQAGELVAPILSAVMSTSPADAQYWIGRKKEFENEVRKLISRNEIILDVLLQIQEWEKFYLKVFNLEFDFSNIVIPEKKSGFDRLLIVAPGMTPQFLFNKCTELFPTWKYINKSLDEVITSDRTAKYGAYAIWLRDRVEADEEMKNISANQIKSQNIVAITLEERLFIELKFYKETGKHLDISNITLCAVSRVVGGGVPGVGWVDEELEVGWYSPVGQSDRLRARVAVV